MLLLRYAMYGNSGQSGRPNWAKIAEHAHLEYGQAQKRWKKYLDPQLTTRKAAPWTAEEVRE